MSRDRELVGSLNRLADLFERRERRERDGETRRKLAEGPAPERRAGVPYDSLGRRIPSRLTALTFTRAIPGYIGKFDKRVPDGMYAIDGDGVIVACPCGVDHVVERLLPAMGECGRHFIFDGTSVRVAHPEGNAPAATS